MATVLQLTRRLTERPDSLALPGVRLRHFNGPEDIALWLSIREGAFARQKLGVRNWEEPDFRAEFLARPWWDPRFLWFAEVTDSPLPRAVGTIGLTWRGSPPDAKPAIHWLAVQRNHRRRGIGRLLLSALETACWDQGQRQIWLETHTAWAEAAEFYRAAGYRPTSDE